MEIVQFFRLQLKALNITEMPEISLEAPGETKILISNSKLVNDEYYDLCGEYYSKLNEKQIDEIEKYESQREKKRFDKLKRKLRTPLDTFISKKAQVKKKEHH